MALIYAFSMALIMAIFTTPAMKWLAVRLNVMDKPGGRKVHRKPIPYLGGGSIFLGFFVATVCFSQSPATGIVLIGATLSVALGMMDDAISIPAKLKLLAQIAIAGGTYWAGVSIDYLTLPFGGTIELGMWSGPITIMWIISFMNVVNLIDGLDGLAGGVSAISAVMIAIVSVQTGQWPAAILSVAIAGAALGFLKYNFSPASIFMGDAGSMFLGYVLACVTILGVLKSEFTISLIIPIIALAVPILDTSFAVVRRLKKGQSIMSADKEHFHHQLLDSGLNVRQSVLLIYICTFLLGIAAIIVGYLDGAIAISFVAITAIVTVGAFRYFRRRPDLLRRLVRAMGG